MKKLSLFLIALTMILFSCKPEVEKPTVVTKSVGEVTKTSAKVVGQVAADGGADITERGVCWSTDGTPTILDYRVKDVEGGLGSYDVIFTGLVPNTQYYVRAYAINKAGTGYGDEKTFTTLGDEPEEPGDEPEQPGDEPEEPGDEPEEPGDEPEEPGDEPEEPGDEPEEPGDEPEEPGDEPEEPGDEPEEPGDEPETPIEPEKPVGPVVITAEVTEITLYSAQCGGGVSDGGGAVVVERGVCWNTIGNPTVLDFTTKDGSGLGSYISNITGLEYGTTYYVRAYAANANGVAGYGKEVTFTTLDKLLPTVTTATEVTDITVSSATCGGEVTFEGNVSVTARGICWNTTGNPTIEDNKTTNGSGVGSYTSNMTNLKHGTTYYVRAYATNEVGTAYGEEVSFTTIEKLLPTVTTATKVKDITVSSATCGGEVISSGNAVVIERGICWSTSQNPTIEDSRTTDGSGVGSFTSNLSNLVSQTTYYVRAYATNEVGTAYGNEVSFTTLVDPANGREYVDLGLSVKWATCNVGANKPEEYGDYFAWGETSSKETYTEDNCPTYKLSISKLQTQGYIDSEGNLTSQYDAATVNWGGTWRMPTYAELKELNTQCTWTWTTQNGVKGYKVKGPNGNSIFLPAAGVRHGSSLNKSGSYGTYWSSTPIDDYDDYAYDLHFSSSYHSMDYFYRYYGRSVRPILE